MASMGAMPFVIDHNAIVRTVLLNHHRPHWIPSFANNRPRKSFSDLTFICDNVAGGRLRRVKATGEKSSGIDAGRDTNDALQVTIDKSTKNFALQTGLQIVERPETPTSTESTSINLEEDRISISSEEMEQAFFDEIKRGIKSPPDSRLGRAAEFSVTDEKLENISEMILDEADVPESEDVESESPPLAGPNVMNVILVAAECAPWSKTGGLGDVAGALPKALAQRGHRVMVVVPLYGNYDGLQDTGINRRYKVGWEDIDVQYLQTYIDGVDFVFIRCHKFNGLGSNIYGGNREEILRRMVLFCKAAVEFHGMCLVEGFATGMEIWFSLQMTGIPRYCQFT